MIEQHRYLVFPRRHFRRGLFLSAVFFSIGLSVYTLVAARAQTPDTAPQALADRVMVIHPSELYQVRARDLERGVGFTGTVNPASQADISSQVSGIANSVSAMPGEAVSADQVLVEIDTTDLHLQLQQQLSTKASTQVQLDAAQQTLERTRSSIERGISPLSGLDAAVAEVNRLQATVASLEAQVEQVETNIERATVHAPFDGIVASRSVEPGQLVNAGSALFSIVDLNRVTVDALVPLSSSSWIQVGQTAHLSIQGMQGPGFDAVVDRINPVAQQGTRSVSVYLSLDNEDLHLRGGMFVSGEIVTAKSPDALAVPVQALREGDGGESVLVVSDGVVVSRTVETGTRWDNLGLVEVLGGIEEGELVLAMPLSGIVAGQAVRIED